MDWALKIRLKFVSNPTILNGSGYELRLMQSRSDPLSVLHQIIYKFRTEFRECSYFASVKKLILLFIEIISSRQYIHYFCYNKKWK